MKSVLESILTICKKNVVNVRLYSKLYTVINGVMYWTDGFCMIKLDSDQTHAMADGVYTLDNLKCPNRTQYPKVSGVIPTEMTELGNKMLDIGDRILPVGKKIVAIGLNGELCDAQSKDPRSNDLCAPG